MEEKKNDVIQTEVGTKKISIGELVKKLENGEVNPRTLDKKILQQCTIYFKTRGYSSEEIAEILGVNERTVQRYLSRVREGNLIIPNVGFQIRCASTFINNWQSQYQRLLKLSYSNELTDNEKVRVIYLLHQLDINKIAALDRLGYLTKAQGMEDAKKTVKLQHAIENRALSNRIKTTSASNSELIEKFNGSDEERLGLILKVYNEETALLDQLIANIIVESDNQADEKQDAENDKAKKPITSAEWHKLPDNRSQGN